MIENHTPFMDDLDCLDVLTLFYQLFETNLVQFFKYDD